MPRTLTSGKYCKGLCFLACPFYILWISLLSVYTLFTPTSPFLEFASPTSGTHCALVHGKASTARFTFSPGTPLYQCWQQGECKFSSPCLLTCRLPSAKLFCRIERDPCTLTLSLINFLGLFLFPLPLPSVVFIVLGTLLDTSLHDNLLRVCSWENQLKRVRDDRWDPMATYKLFFELKQIK